MKRTVIRSVVSSPKRARKPGVSAPSLQQHVHHVDHLQLVLEAQVPGQIVAAIGDLARCLRDPLPLRAIDLNDPDLVGDLPLPHQRPPQEGDDGGFEAKMPSQ